MKLDERPVHREAGTGKSLCGYTGFHLKYEKEHGEVTCRRCNRIMDGDRAAAVARRVLKGTAQ